jgi:hypothetical protein
MRETAAYRPDVQRLSLAVIGLIAVAVGVVWTLQGTNVLGGSGMSGHHVWAVIGVVLIVVGFGFVGAAARKGRQHGP